MSRRTSLAPPEAVRPARRARRGTELVEFALVFPVFMFLFFGVMEFSWYFFQRGGVTEASRLGCQAASHVDPEADDDGNGIADYLQIAEDVIDAELGRQAGITCGEGGFECEIEFDDLSAPGNDPQRIICTTRVNYRSLTGFLGNDDDPGGSGGDLATRRFGSEDGARLLPEFIVGRSVAIFEGAD